MADKALKENTSKLVRAKASFLRISPRKMRLLTSLVKGMRVDRAMAQLQHENAKAAPMLARLIKSAVANAKNNFSLDPEKLFIKDLACNMGPSMTRYSPRARGSAFVIRKQTSHVNIVLEEKTGKVSKSAGARVSFFKKKTEITEDKEKVIQTTREAPKAEGKKSQIVKDEQQMKQSKIQQKRRLFNRKSG
ncbi:MAG: 50S ribosomal protein L22 [Candidatus Doudnabacteria bacterium CG10_big_fil_rev_8_21_14_0_10_42_18]|uniref:Large ribosomal subunit protein uL22 n=1 Tax=Candidatus Doudnabacteria bacterium CG10_big_fil_rev_8_21_14_0_10_42_18 TaxID=1974552 RepID=A0A2H0VBK8_9BACT|nr:MAG: 50S ribosomal protein L22 [Candidatus Doudnabacteria bacterium CG10_big_fil_rev_8_21_14_0_10_42_18]